MEINGLWEGWRVTDKIGEGAFGAVYVIEKDEYGDVFKSALKVIRIPQNSSEIDSLISEGSTSDDISKYFNQVVENIVSEFKILYTVKGHSNIVSYEDHKVVQHPDGMGWDILIRMELLTPFYKYISGRKLGTDEVVKLGIDICKALEVCEQKNIIHRDIKPENIFVSSWGDFKLGDFGVAREMEKAMTTMSQKGTLYYMAPEVYSGKNYDRTVDIYSLGLVLYRYLNDGKLPFMSGDGIVSARQREDALLARLKGGYIAPPQNADSYLAEVVLKACAYSKENRFQSAQEMRMALEEWQYRKNEPGEEYNDTVVIHQNTNPANELRDSASNLHDISDNTLNLYDIPDNASATEPLKKPRKKDKRKPAIIAAICVVWAVLVAAIIALNVNKKTDKTVTEALKTETTESTSGENTTSGEKTTTEKAKSEASEETEENAGKVLNIYSWNDEFEQLMENYYDGYERVDSKTGKIGDVQVNWILSSDYNSYCDFLTAALDKQDKADLDDKVDIFLAERDYFYLGEYYAVPISELGIKEDELSEQYGYTKQLMSDSSNKTYGLTWQVCAGGLIYNRRIAKDMWGTDDPEVVQEYVKDWNTFYDTAYALAEHGYRITATDSDIYLVYATGNSEQWVEDDALNVSEKMQEWVEESLNLCEAGATLNDYIWSDAWYDGLEPDSNVFAYFGPMWLINDYFDDNGEYGLAAGPESFSWGGSWICAASGTDNEELIADIMRDLTINEDTMREIAGSDNEFVNNKSVMEEVLNDSTYGNDVLNGQNPFGILMECAELVNVDYKTIYDSYCEDVYQTYMLDYIDGIYSTYDDALSGFRSYVISELGLRED